MCREDRGNTCLFQTTTECSPCVSWGANLSASVLPALVRSGEVELEWHLVANRGVSLSKHSPLLRFWVSCSLRRKLGWFVFWNLAVLCKTIPSFCPGSSALLGERITASKNVVCWFLDFYYFCWGLLEKNVKKSSRNCIRGSKDLHPGFECSVFS